MSPAHLAFAALSLLGSMQSAEAMGINCDGSSFCRMSCENFTVSRIHRLVSEGIGNGWGGQTYWQNERIACVKAGIREGILPLDSCCAYYQNVGPNGGGTLEDVLESVRRIGHHGCKFCGSSSVYKHADLQYGELTINYVSHKNYDTECVDGLCRSIASLYDKMEPAPNSTHDFKKLHQRPKTEEEKTWWDRINDWVWHSTGTETEGGDFMEPGLGFDSSDLALQGVPRLSGRRA